MMRKRFFWVCLMTAVILSLQVQSVFAEGDGSLQLNEDMITNSNMGAGSSSDFPIRSRLFSLEMNQAAKEDKIAEDKYGKEAAANLKFEAVMLSVNYQTDVDQVVSQLFAGYNPTILDHHDAQTKTENYFWYILMIAVGILLVIMAACLGRWNAGRKGRKAHARSH